MYSQFISIYTRLSLIHYQIIRVLYMCNRTYPDVYNYIHTGSMCMCMLSTHVELLQDSYNDMM